MAAACSGVGGPWIPAVNIPNRLAFRDWIKNPHKNAMMPLSDPIIKPVHGKALLNTGVNPPVKRQ